MSLLFRVIYAAQASSTHHKLALDALTYLSHPSSNQWRDLFLKYHSVYLRGAKDPDTIFKDFRNHVLHVSENYWGGAAITARGWYERTVELLQREEWEEAIYAAGVLSHYFTDPIMPFHTGQTTRESQIHRAAEWSVTKSYNELMRYATEQGEIPKLKVPTTQDWLEEFVRQGATLAHEYYHPLIEHYDFEIGSRYPEAGWDDYAQKVLSQLLMYAAVSFSMVLDRAFYESKATPAETDLTLETFLATISMPVNWISKKMEHLAEQSEVEAIYRELKATGKLVYNLPEEQRVVKEWADRARHANSSLKSNKKQGLARPISTQVESPPPAPTRKTGPTPPPVPVANRSTLLEPTPIKAIPPLSPAALKAEESSLAATASPTRVEHKPARQLEPAPVHKPTKTSPRDFDIPVANAKSSRELEKQAEIDLLEAARLSVEQAQPRRPEIKTVKPEPVKQHVVEKSPVRYEQILPTAPAPISKTPPPVPAAQASRDPQYHLELSSDVVDAPSIGPKTAARFYRINVKTVADFLKLDAKTTANRLNTSHIKPDTIREWQDQARLVCQIPGLRGYHAQILVGCGYRTPADVAKANVDDLSVQAWDFSQTSIGQSVLRNSQLPEVEKMQGWINAARQARTLAAA